MGIDSTVYSFNKSTAFNDDSKTIKLLGMLGIFSLSSLLLAYYMFNKGDSYRPQTLPKTITTYNLSLDMPALPERVTPPRFSPFEKADQPVYLTLRLRKSFIDTLLSYGVPRTQIDKIITSAEPHANLTDLPNGHKFNIKIEKNKSVDVFDIDDDMHIVRNISINPSPGIKLDIAKDGDQYKTNVIYSQVYENAYLAAGKVTSSISADARRAGVPRRMVNKFIKLFSLNVDFRRLQKDDSFEFGFDRFTTKDGEVIGFSPLTYASLTVDGKKHEIFYIRNKDGSGKWINEKGMNNKPLLMKTPIDGARLSSRFGMRRHPVLGYTRKHKGIDFAAPTGTPIYAAGDGVIVKKYRSSSYGNFIKIRHNNTYDTAYAHMSRFARLSEGQKVKQGQVIGYVGTTGRSTGPHLHYEVHKNGQAVNPLSNKIPNVSTVTADMRTKLENAKKKLASLRSGKTIQLVHKTVKDVQHKIL